MFTFEKTLFDALLPVFARALENAANEPTPVAAAETTAASIVQPASPQLPKAA
jgi:hypothetical protein